ncbi:50S ribosomal protein L6 [Candidatus Pacearchaeota archaeon]|nr:50S ribosomal protein L6 [Candidatus Pacearchaeota archaeon]
MKKALEQKIEIPEGVEVQMDGSFVSAKGSEGEFKRKFNFANLKVEKKDREIIVSHQKATKKEKKIMNTLATHLKNMIKGVKEKFEYRLKVCFSHFPITVEARDSEVIIKNFLGEKIPRKAKMPEGVEVEVKGQEITVSSVDKELAGQAAANFEKATKVKGKDRRVFQDGIFITHKAGREI